jgi:hypothetical protein
MRQAAAMTISRQLPHFASATTAYEISIESSERISTTFEWPSTVDDFLAAQIVELMRETTLDTPIIGFGTTISDDQARRYMEELKGNLAAGKLHLLLAIANSSRLIGTCVLRRNLNPNNRHIADLAKGMISTPYRGGGLVLASAFLEIGKLCERESVELLTLDVRAGTRAHKVWERFGFETYGVLADYARVDGESIAGHFMAQSVRKLRETCRSIVDHAKAASNA